MNTEETVRFLEAIADGVRRREVASAEAVIEFDPITIRTESGNILYRQGPHRKFVLELDYGDVPDLQAGEEREEEVPPWIKRKFDLKVELMTQKERPV